ncbi:PREDICTED: uncharacterized protein LOC109477537 [Branchiostoma belcheri]|uniref:Uncharacterized protein LOC109477537 n=1 Tax=Branchiostoma belcheri TaxID=7741 RepID=A0A6P4YYH2_BRABE|nr:PREDICTED: uncharacterized protein LOC109477537 [Branchiostoma belcheri]
MGEFRTLVLAKVLSVRDSCCLYVSCTHCYRKLHQHTDGNRYECLRCHAVYIAADIRYRYCLNLTVTDDQTLCEVAVFGTCLEPFFGISANGLKSFLQNHLKTSKASTPNNPDSLLHEALQKSLVGLMFLFGFKVKCERSRSQRERHSPVRIRSILEKTCQQRNGYLGKNLPQLVAHQLVHANRDTPFVSVLDLLKWIILETDDNKARETSTSEFGVPRNTLPSRRSVNSSDISWCSGNSARTSFGQTLSRVSLGQQSLVLSCDEGNSLMSSTMSDDLQNESDEKTDSSINHSTYSWDETYYEENLQLHSESYYFHANASEVAKQNEVCDVQVEGLDGRMENRACSATRHHVVIDDVGGGGNEQEGKNDVHQECSNTSGCENMSAQFLEGAFDETCWEGETPGNLSHEEQQNDHQSDRGDGSAMRAHVQKEQAAAIGEMCHDCTHLHTSDETCGDPEVEALYNPQLAGQEAYSWTHEHDIPTCKTSTEDEVPNEELSFDESVNDSYLLLAELNSDDRHMPEKDNDKDHFDCCSDQTHNVCKREVDPTHQGSSSGSEDVRHHETKTSCDDLPYSEGLDTFIDQLDQPVQGPLERLRHTTASSHEKDMADSNVEDKISRQEECLVQPESGISKNCTNIIEDNGLNMKEKHENMILCNIEEEKEIQAMWQEDFPYSEDLDAFLAEMDENITVERERKEDVHVVKEIAQRPIEDETDKCVTSVETTVDIHQCRAETGSTADMEGSRTNSSLLKTNTDKKDIKNTDKIGRTKSLFERLVRRKTILALNSAETDQTTETSDESIDKETEEKDSRDLTGECDSDSDSTSRYRDKIVSESDTDSVLSMSSSVQQPSVVRSSSIVSIPDSEKGETSSAKFPTGDKSVEQPQDSTENVVFMAASEENHDFSALFDESFGHLSDTESVGPCRDSCGEVGGVNELPDTPGPPSRAASVLRASRTSTRSFNMENTETSPVTKNGKIPSCYNYKTANRARRCKSYSDRKR